MPDCRLANPWSITQVHPGDLRSHVKRCKIIKKAQAKAQATAMPIQGRVPTEDGIQELLKLVDLLPPPETNAGKTSVLPTKQFLAHIVRAADIERGGEILRELLPLADELPAAPPPPPLPLPSAPPQPILLLPPTPPPPAQAFFAVAPVAPVTAHGQIEILQRLSAGGIRAA